VSVLSFNYTRNQVELAVNHDVNDHPFISIEDEIDRIINKIA